MFMLFLFNALRGEARISVASEVFSLRCIFPPGYSYEFRGEVPTSNSRIFFALMNRDLNIWPSVQQTQKSFSIDGW
jgi:hypothetical protein